MDDKATARVSRRWDGPTFDADGKYLVARLRVQVPAREHAAGIEPAVFGPTEWACIAETVRQDRLWAEYPLWAGDGEGARRRRQYLAGGGA
ncbi:hypothetical protein Acsp04_46510 [Actinomadura sp. NBRC 104425]|uniref:hypothetical protein n=1 Tax=Actinomadura sp. NBRC 104425 TaxID=3032204 RepID=UPI0024A180EA|nr:hypothetical protein [Actinomadura sp. NBRC 104425]GLZ14416.1 hypothetical protein Acsp04_46510 [Actinomadura sp. NBRC 104425]